MGFTDVFAESLNAPSGAGCLLTRRSGPWPSRKRDVLMHLLVLGAF
ncbi:hypothetical protein HMPREF1979_01051 [Actinomyces johnsonii F0542]|uniref:Uncharacterized protein n=1 Tax=Actinomyces johnsonii F0542 TaxID=1321818 RepID=U1QS30_9ACTO|nr:hypothetical protein HMPREF1979_01051 [Actinomyces johnsonii F0542]